MRHDIVPRKSEALAFIIMLPDSHLSILGDLAPAFDNVTRINIAYRGDRIGVTFSPKSGKI